MTSPTIFQWYRILRQHYRFTVFQAVRGARQILRDKTRLPRPGRVTVSFGPLVVPDPSAGNDWHEIVRLRDATREIIANGTGEPLL